MAIAISPEQEEELRRRTVEAMRGRSAKDLHPEDPAAELLAELQEACSHDGLLLEAFVPAPRERRWTRICTGCFKEEPEGLGRFWILNSLKDPEVRIVNEHQFSQARHGSFPD